jgi:hypothetical protein
MCSPWIRNEGRQRRIAIVAICLVAGSLLFSGPSTFAQDAAPPDTVAPTPSTPPPASKPGVFESIGRFFDKGAKNFSEHLRGAKRKMDDLGDDAAANSKEISDQAAKAGKSAADAGKSAVDATKSAVDAVAKLPTARMMSGRERCMNAPNGAPDCLAAAEALCRKHGYSTGKSMDFTSAEECPPKSLLGPAQPECTTVTFISRAMCQ